MFLTCHVRILEWIHTIQLPGCQGIPSLKSGPMFCIYFFLSFLSITILIVHLFFFLPRPVAFHVLYANICWNIFQSILYLVQLSVIYFLLFFSCKVCQRQLGNVAVDKQLSFLYFLTKSMLITAYRYFFNLRVTGSLVMRFGP